MEAREHLTLKCERPQSGQLSTLPKVSKMANLLDPALVGNVRAATLVEKRSKRLVSWEENAKRPDGSKESRERLHPFTHRAISPIYQQEISKSLIRSPWLLEEF